MEIFSEIYSCYFNAMSEILDSSIDDEISNETIEKIIQRIAFSESSLYILPKIKNNKWSFFENNKSKIKNETSYPLTKMQKMWLCSIFNDIRINLFFDKNAIDKFKKYFKDNKIKPLFDKDDFYAFDQFRLGDNYFDKFYIEKFKILSKAVKNLEVLKIYYNSAKNKRIIGYFRVFKIEYSKKNDTHRVYVMKINSKKVNVFNISRIIKIENTEKYEISHINFDEYFDYNLSNEPVVIEISNERNALERCMLQFASYNKKTEFDENSGKYICYIYYNKDLETELLIQVLSFIPNIKVLGHKNFLNEVLIRVNSQKLIMEKSYSDD